MKNIRINKVTLKLAGKPIIHYPVELLQNVGIDPVFIVVGHEGESVRRTLASAKVKFIEQNRRLGTGHAVRKVLPQLPDDLTDILVIYGDDSFAFTKDLVKRVINIHSSGIQPLTFLTVKVDNPTGMGRIVRDSSGRVVDIIEERDADEKNKSIKEINPNCFIFKVSFLKKYLPLVPKSTVTGEYYLTSIIKVAIKYNQAVETIDGGRAAWRGINTEEDYKAAQKIFK